MKSNITKTFFILFAWVLLVKSDVVLKPNGFSNPINFFQAIEHFKNRIDFNQQLIKNIGDLSNFSYESIPSNFHNYITESVNDALENNGKTLEISEKCNDDLKLWMKALKDKELWAISGNKCNLTINFLLLFYYLKLKFLTLLVNHQVEY